MDTSAAELLARAEGRPPLHNFSVEDARRVLSEAIQAGQGAAEQGLYSRRDLIIPTAIGGLEATLSWPRPGGGLPLLIYFHGGGWTLLSRQSCQVLCDDLAQLGDVAVLSVDYRRAPESPYPAAVDDAEASLRFVLDNAEALRIDPSRIILGGDSAGGNIAAACTLSFSRHPSLIGQLLIYPVMEIASNHASRVLNAKGYLLEDETMRWFGKHYLQNMEQAEDLTASPGLAKDLSKIPPTLVLSAGFDPLRDEAENYARRLAEAGKATTLLRFPGQLHGFLLYKAIIPEVGLATAHLGHWLRQRVISSAM